VPDVFRDAGSEDVVLGSMMLDPAAITAVGEILEPDDLYYSGLYLRLIIRHAAGEPTDVAAMAVVVNTSSPPLVPEVTPLDLVRMIEAVPTAVQAPWFARRVRDVALRRRVHELGRSMASWAADGQHETAGGIILEAARRIEGLAAAVDPPERSVTAEAFLELEFAHGAPVIPGVLHGGERVIVVAPEGAGKSTLLRQAWMACAAGVHPFAWHERIPRVRTLYVDLENPGPLLQARVRALLRTAGGGVGDYARIWSKPGGIDLLSPSDAAALDALIAHAKPALICVGPLYKAMRDTGARAETIHAAHAAYWDRVRERHGCALWMEAHAPLATGGQSRLLRPMGSGVWSRWPEFGIALQVPKLSDGLPAGALIVDRFRGDRDDRPWPAQLLRNTTSWPWKAVYHPRVPRP